MRATSKATAVPSSPSSTAVTTSSILGVPLQELAEVKYLFLDLFAGMDGLGYALEASGISDFKKLGVLMIFFETDTRCRKLLAARRVRPGAFLSSAPDAEGLVGSVFAFTDADCFYLQTLLQACPSLKLVFIGGGSPCVGFSQANPSGKGINDPRSNMVWSIPVLANRARAFLPASVSVVFFLENVDMQAHRRPPLDETLHVPGIKSCASAVLPCNRPREYWLNLDTSPPPPIEVKVKDYLDPGWAPLWDLDKGESDRPLRRFGTFLRPFGPGAPREYPAQFTRLPLSMYSESGLVFRPDAPPAQLEVIRDLVRRCVHCNTSDLKTVGGAAVKLRGELAEWIHLKGGSAFLRPLNGRERDRCLGFPPFASALPGEEGEDSITWGRLEATGNSYAVAVVASLLRPLCKAILAGSVPKLLPGTPTVSSASAALQALGAVSSQPLPNRRR